ncbi:MAG: NHLP leader peptide family RiPP precursor [Nitrospinae bacterium]|nr:NHLP leader peptide family RiPP precursor [Nitrospinota bacterium]
MKTVEEIRDDIIRKASVNEAFRADLLSDPKAAIEKELGVTIPEGFKIGVHQDNLMSINLVLPPAELSEADLSAVVAGAGSMLDLANAWNSLNQNS